MKRRLHLYLVLALLVGLLVGLATLAVSVEKTRTLETSSKWSASYSGLGIVDSNGVFGFQYREFLIDDLPNRTWSVSRVNSDCHPMVGYYPDGSICAKGFCRIEGTGRNMYPLIDEVCEATTYKPDGTVGSRVVNGTGRFALYFPDGTLNWEFVFADYERISYSHWDEDGELLGTWSAGSDRSEQEME